jgi:hypothetical protein
MGYSTLLLTKLRAYKNSYKKTNNRTKACAKKNFGKVYVYSVVVFLFLKELQKQIDTNAQLS